MRCYGHSYRDTMGLPMRAFWQLSGTVPRLMIGENKETLELLTAATHNPQGASEMSAEMAIRAPDPVKLTSAALIQANSVRDEAGFDELRNMA